MTKLLELIKLTRPKHWVKNILVFVPIVYAQAIGDAYALLAAAAAFGAFCLVASAVYVVNDIADCEKDARHPINKTRPIAAGRLSKRAAALFACFLMTAGLAVALAFGGTLVFVFVLAYVFLNLLYTYILKHQAVIDCFCIAAGFVLRIYAGGAAVGEGISEWLFLTVTVGSLFMAFGKRRGELAKSAGGVTTRPVLQGYSMGFLNGAVYACAGMCIVFYALWAMGSTALMIYTVPLFIFIICRYLLSAQAENSYGDPVSVIFGDKMLVGAAVFFAALSFAFLYL